MHGHSNIKLTNKVLDGFQVRTFVNMPIAIPYHGRGKFVIQSFMMNILTVDLVTLCNSLNYLLVSYLITYRS